MANAAQVNVFKVTIDALAFGSWTKVDGLKASYDVKEWNEGGQNNYVHKLPGRLKFENITLNRVVSEDTNAVAGWVASFQIAVRRSTGSIAVCDSAGREVFRWALTGIFPVSWSVNAFDASGNGMATETLVLGHDGFLDAAAAGGAVAGAVL